jgi:flagellin-like hook-associated protein FlgL
MGGISDFTVKLTAGLHSDHVKYDIATAGANLSAAGSKITDAMAAREIIESTRVKILSGAKISVSGQANQSHSNVINLIR